jgi:hypothetical protein
MISTQVIAQIGLTEASARPATLNWGFHEFETVPAVGEIIIVWHDDEPEQLRVVRVEHRAANEAPDTDFLGGGPVPPITRVVAQWLNE